MFEKIVAYLETRMENNAINPHPFERKHVAVAALLVEASRLAAALAHPVIPKSSDQLLAQLGFPGNLSVAWGVLAAGHQLGEPSPVFPRLDAESDA